MVTKQEFRTAMGIQHKQDLTVWCDRYGLDLSKHRNHVDLVEVIQALVWLLTDMRDAAAEEEDLDRIKLAEEVQKLKLGNHQAESASRQLAMEHFDAVKCRTMFADLLGRLDELAIEFKGTEAIRGPDAQERYNAVISEFKAELGDLLA